ncbi:hypothetical protein Tco_0043009 [Tanacetum coccineum]
MNTKPSGVPESDTESTTRTLATPEFGTLSETKAVFRSLDSLLSLMCCSPEFVTPRCSSCALLSPVHRIHHGIRCTRPNASDVPYLLLFCFDECIKN